jgi:magnesium-protoporphyrin IX monomethyl ester (oxidative) cyclase
MRVLLLRQYFDVQYPTSALFEPLALEYLAAVVRDTHEVAIYDCIGEGYDEYEESDDMPGWLHFGKREKDIFKKIDSFKPEVIGMNVHFYEQAHNVTRVLKAIREKYPHIKTMAGGVYPTIHTKKLFEDNGANLDIAVLGEGEITFKELLDKKLRNLKTINGLAFQENGKLIFTPPRELIKDLDTIPFPARDLVPYENYSKIFFHMASLRLKMPRRLYKMLEKIIYLPVINDIYYYGIYEPIRFLRRYRSVRIPFGLMMTTRGCPFRCTFCASHTIWKGVYRQRSAQNVLQELEELKKKYHVRHINFLDDNLTLSKQRTIELCKGMIEKKLNLTYDNISGIYAGSLDYETIKLMKKAGWYELWIAVESGNQKILDTIVNKHIDLEKIKQVVKWCRELKMKPGAYFILGFPGETLKDMQDTFNFALNNDFYMVRVYPAMPLEGSKMYDDCVKYGYLTPDYDKNKIDFFDDTLYIETKDFKREQVMDMIRKLRALLSKKRRLRMQFDKNYKKDLKYTVDQN